MNLIGNEMARACAGVFPLQNTHIYKVKVLKAPKLTIESLTAEIPVETKTTQQSGETGTEVKQ